MDRWRRCRFKETAVLIQAILLKITQKLSYVKGKLFLLIHGTASWIFKALRSIFLI